MFFNLPLKFEHFKIKIIHESKKTSFKKVQTNNLLNNDAAIKYVIFYRNFFGVYRLYLPSLYKFESVSLFNNYTQAEKSPVNIYKYYII